MPRGFNVVFGSTMIVAMRSILVVAAILATAVDGETAGTREGKRYTVDLSNLMDRAMPYISKFMIDNKLDPLPLPDQDQSIWIPQPITVIWKADVGLRSGTLHSLSTLHREGRTILTYKDKVVTVDGGVGLDKLMALYNYFVDLKYLRVDGHATIEPKTLSVGINLQFDANKYKFDLRTFKVRSIGEIEVDLKGNALIDWATTPLTNFIIDIFKDLIVWAVEDNVKKTLQGYLDGLTKQFPRRHLYEVGPVLGS